MPASAAPLEGYDVPEALSALRALFANPDDTMQVFRILRALPGSSRGQMLARFERDRGGRALLAERPELLPRLTDQEALRGAPAGSLAQAYLGFLEREGITAAGLIRASEDAGGLVLDGRHPRAAEMDWLNRRLRDSHDLWHVVTGWAGDLVGEGALLAFTLVQTRAPGIALIVGGAALRGGVPGLRRELVRGARLATRSAWLPAVRWEDWLARPLPEVRRALAVPTPHPYAEVRPRDLGLGASPASTPG